MVLLGLFSVGKLVLGEHFEPARLLVLLREAGGQGFAVPLFIVLFGVVTSVFVPGVAMAAVAGATWGFFPGWLIVWVASNVWTTVGFGVGRTVRDGRLQEWLAKRGGGIVARELKDGGVLSTVMLRQIPLPFVAVNISAGMTALSWRDWTFGNFLGLLPACLIYSSLASAIVEGAAGAKEQAAVRAVISAVSIFCLGALTRWLQRRRHMSAPASKEPGA